MALWEQRLRNTCDKRPGWSVRANRGRVLVAVVQGENWQQKTLPKHLRWAEECEEEITEWLRALYRNWDNGTVTLAVAFDKTAKSSDKVGEQFTASWSEIKEAYRVRLMETGNNIQLKTWQSNYEVYIDAAIEVLKASRPADGPTLLRLTARRWADHYSARAVCVSTLKGFTEFAVKDSRFRAPASWLIDEFHAAPIRGQKPEKLETAALADEEILELIQAVEARWGEGWRNVLITLVGLGIRPFELTKIEARTNSDGELQMYSTYRKAGGAKKTDPRWLEEVPLEVDGIRHDFNIAAQWNSWAWPQTRDGGRREISAHYVEQYLKKVDFWNHLRLEYFEEGLKVVPYSTRNSWNVRARSLGLPDQVLTRAFGNTPATNVRSYRQTTDALTRKAFREALGR